MAENPDLKALSGKILAVLGPTGCGKSAFSIELALSIPSEIISSDSMAVYRGVEIGTDKVPAASRRGIPHHLYDVAEPGTFFSAGLFRAMATDVIEGIRSRNRLPILVGGTGLYARSLLEGIASAPSRDEALRARLKERSMRKGLPSLYRILRRLDGRRALDVSPNDEIRIVRSLEIRILTGKPFSLVMEEGRNPAAQDAFKICLTLPRPLLYRRIEERVDRMVSLGLVEEARSLWMSDRLSGPIAKAIGYKELVPHFEGRASLADSIEEIKKNSRNLAKRQLTWFRKENGLEWVRMEDEHERLGIREKVTRWLKGERYDR
ncbi:MAG TPA: tRNA (adenosine(37)-N6)-dimethylallyltransferase MiaA [Acidobacteriota bacterium]|jgi:tRNA dimethylallyltransferase|nr:tRNA (adenosine(37)-N6)-dimethylallyltransferase MiaA [Acidobacteriota bacterium]HNT18443.1 tRNA (adenosine(37)-N6)-dimethylallyltransferase MiaA [Acidobacteriota bacterium]HPA26716.1 tRNA (adenosine(37)-N6)-dimethylallyltransferase MiaA [Acidobacteriota bacterium]HQO20249.1 tRNA (adenosine(37)-N6)-dimethylallyltransferase MiaA [Acidobacteriota bacterium]HQQ46908.1 tRNA (adenosine(37)-N6)-dimethylallyltransferase MiaA [Acidobacteriota bacterium]